MQRVAVSLHQPPLKRLRTQQSSTIHDDNAVDHLIFMINSKKITSSVALLHNFMQKVRKETPIYTCQRNESSGYTLQIISNHQLIASGQHPSHKNEAKRVAAENALSLMCPDLLSLLKKASESNVSSSSSPLRLGSPGSALDVSKFLQRVNAGKYSSQEAFLCDVCLDFLEEPPQIYVRQNTHNFLAEISLGNKVVSSGADIDKDKAKQKAVEAYLVSLSPELHSAFKSFCNSISSSTQQKEKTDANVQVSIFDFPKPTRDKVSQKLERKIKSKSIRSLGSLLHEICQHFGLSTPLFAYEFEEDKKFVASVTINKKVIARAASSISTSDAKNLAIQEVLCKVFPNLLSLLSIVRFCPEYVSPSRLSLPEHFISELRSGMASYRRCSILCGPWDNDHDPIVRFRPDMTEFISSVNDD